MAATGRISGLALRVEEIAERSLADVCARDFSVFKCVREIMTQYAIVIDTVNTYAS